MSEWHDYQLGEIVEFIDGDRGKNYPSKDDFVNDGFCLFLNTGNVTKHGFDFTDCMFITEDKDRQLRKGKLSYGDVILTTRGTIGNVAYYNQSNKYVNVRINSGMLIVRKKQEIISEYIYHLFRSSIMQQRFKKFSSGSAQPQLPVKDLNCIVVSIPDHDIQKKISNSIFAYDKLIENNNRRIAILEEMAQRLYREWFVHFRFPGHENVEMVDSELGMIPEGWQVEKADEVISTQYGYTETADDKEIGPKYVRGTDINKNSFITWATVPYCQISDKKLSKYQLKVGDVLIIRMADPGKIGIVEKDIPAVFASYLIRLTPVDEQLTPYYLFYMASHAPFQNFVLGASTGATRKSISAETIKEAKIIVPPREVQELFDKRVFPIRKMINLLLDKTENLRKTRDHLLPRLISGDIDVSKIEI